MTSTQFRIVAALGGNALIQRGEQAEADIQEGHIRQAVRAMQPLLGTHQLVVTHGNGPQVGLLAAESERDPALSRPYPFDVLVAQTQGMIGYWLVQALENATEDRLVAGVVCQTLVRPNDPAFLSPSKFVGPGFDEAAAARLTSERGWTMARDGAAWRRVVASPAPIGIAELPLILRLTDDPKTLVVCGGGGGVPVVTDAEGHLSGVEAVVDKDATSALIAEEIGADLLLLLTDVPAVERDFGTKRATPIGRATVAELRSEAFPPGSMGPKVEAACRFVEHTAKRAVIGRLDDCSELVAGRRGTTVVP